MVCDTCYYGGHYCGRGLIVPANSKIRECIGYAEGPALNKLLGNSMRWYLENRCPNVLEQAPKFSFPIVGYRVFNKRNNNLYRHRAYLIEVDPSKTNIHEHYAEIVLKYTDAFVRVLVLGSSSYAIYGASTHKRRAAKYKHMKRHRKRQSNSNQ